MGEKTVKSRFLTRIKLCNSKSPAFNIRNVRSKCNEAYVQNSNRETENRKAE